MISVSFTCRESKVDKLGTAIVEMYLSDGKSRVSINLGIKEKPNDFRRKYSSRKGNALKDFLFRCQERVNILISSFAKDGIPPTAKMLKEYFLNGYGYDRVETLYEVRNEFIAYYNERFRAGEICYNTYYKFVRLFERLMEYFGRERILNTITTGDILLFRTHLLSIMKEVAMSKQLAMTKTIFIYAKNKGYVSANPFVSIKISKKLKEVEFLTVAEIETIEKYESDIERLVKVRDLFLLQIYTCMAYVDVTKISKESITEIDGQKCIRGRREKTGVVYTAPLNEKALAILEKYDYKMNLLSNQKLNSYLKEIADACGIKKNLHSHMARHSGACLLLNKGYSLEVVAKILGHTTTRLTEHYAKLLDKTVVKAFRALG